ncbi:hypothetical protein [Hydrogenophaga sp.]|jgi:hypothetical protein|uniref:hypothetical protein n=1 Tax=Hydrogenophaga sp. TaxID=1904254 RepID=UPI00260B6C3B|nr:hypothetical protein [Hydrogenophaga sp.]
MKTPDETPDTAADLALRTAMRRSLADSPAQGLDDLQAKAMAQWRQHAQVDPVVALGSSAGWHALPRTWALAALALAAAALLLLNTAPDPAMDELMQPDVLSLISLGEL